MSVTWPLAKPYSPTGFVNQAMLDAAYVDPLNDLYARLADTGWVALSYPVGFHGTAAVRRIGSLVLSRGQISADSSGNMPAAYTSVATLPSASFTPAVDTRAPLTGSGSASGAAGMHALLVAGNTGVSVGGSATVTAVYFNLPTWTAD